MLSQRFGLKSAPTGTPAATSESSELVEDVADDSPAECLYLPLSTLEVSIPRIGKEYSPTAFGLYASSRSDGE